MVAGDREDRPFQFAFTFGNEVRDAFVGVPKVSQNTELMWGETGAHRVGLQDVRVETLLLDVDAKRRMIGGAHDQVEGRLRPGVLKHKAKEVFVVYTPLVARGQSSHPVAAVNFFKPLFAAKFADA